MSVAIVKTSKFLSLVLRHRPELLGLTLDSQGWVSIAELIAAAQLKNHTLSLELIHEVVATNNKKRFTLSEDGQKIRAAQGHSTQQVCIDYPALKPPEFLYHGTSTRFVNAIAKNGLLPQTRHFVHLSADEATAIAVGKRHGPVVVLTVKALVMHEQGFLFYQAENGVWLTDKVPAQFLSQAAVLDSEG